MGMDAGTQGLGRCHEPVTEPGPVVPSKAASVCHLKKKASCLPGHVRLCQLSG